MTLSGEAIFIKPCIRGLGEMIKEGACLEKSSQGTSLVLL